MASASSSAQAAFGLGRRKKNPGLLDQIGKFFGGDKKRKGKGSFRGALSPAPQKASATSPRKRGAENAVVHFFRTIVSSEMETLLRGCPKFIGTCYLVILHPNNNNINT
uniref:Myelin basic protein n=1 Tax=Poecilia latipinna TaxID=48699 RepID=A0A3B3U1N7_9TELE